jgi:hypothetical protein
MTALRLLPITLMTAVGVAGEPKLAPPATAKIDFDKEVRPILAMHCVKCHGAEKSKGGLRLDDAKKLADGGNSGPAIVPGKSAESRLIHAVAGADADLKMPPEGPELSAAQVGILRAWIDQGAKWGDGPITTTTAKSKHWAFQPIRRPPVPAIQKPPSALANPIDAFILGRLEKEALSPSPPASKATLLRRVTLDLIGLPPSPKEVDEFLADESPQAYEKVVDRLLASPHYGERWGRHWLDSARYADSDGYEKDSGRPFAWRYRDWVIRALNDNLPFDRFTVEQLAGDLLPDATIDQRIATGFHRNTLTNKEGGVDQEEFRVAACIDRVNTTGKVWLGLTVGCCQCHDHKYDPLSQREFYQLFAFFNSDRETDIDAPLPGEAEKLKTQREAFEVEKTKLQSAVAEAKEKKLPAAELTKREKALAAYLQKAPAVSKAMTLSVGPTRPTHVMIRGDFLRKGVEVKAGVPQVLPGARPMQTRLDLARWIVSPDNPLTARVTVNWVWAKYFGRGLVSTPEDFGTQGAKPSYPELLDWLASEFKQPTTGKPWDLKRLHKLIVMSNTYRQSSAIAPGHLAKDPLNVLFARQSRLRLEAEIVRDSALAAAGLLNRTIGGPSVRPPQPAGISELTYANSAKWQESAGPEKYKRGLYIWFQRTSPYPMLTTFDSPDSNVCVVRRERSNTPLQALTILNDVVFVEAAQALAQRVQLEKKEGRMEYAVRVCLGREPASEELKRLSKLFGDLKTLAEKDAAGAEKLVGRYRPEGEPLADAAAWVGVCRAILNLDEFVTRE